MTKSGSYLEVGCLPRLILRKMKTFENQSELPRLPIPTLEHTAKVYLKSVEPLLSPEEFGKYSLVVQDFVKGLGQELQKRLIAHDKTQPNSWLESWWLNLAYLSWRNPVLIDSNWFVLAETAKDVPIKTRFTEGYSDIQVTNAAGFTSAFLDYKHLLDQY